LPGFRVGQPEKHGRKWRVRVHGPDGRCRAPGFDTREEAEAFARETRSQVAVDGAWKRAADLQRQADEARAFALCLQGRSLTVGQAAEKFELAEREKGLRPVSLDSKRFMLRGLCGGIFDQPMAAVTVQQAQEFYTARSQAMVGRKKHLIAASTHHAELKLAREFWSWAGSQGWAPINVWRDVKPTGRAESGKEQLSTEEAQKLHAVLQSALASDNPSLVRQALGAGLALYQGFRALEIVNLSVRFVASDGSRIEIRKAKTRKGKRAARVPDFLHAPLAAMRKEAEARAIAAGREPAMEPLLPFESGWPRLKAFRFCDLAGVPRVCAHALRGMHGSLGMEGGSTAEAVAHALGHTSTRVTLKHYVTPDAAHAAQTDRVLLVLDDGGKKP
jgi:integrase